MNLSVIGTGYVGLVQGACFADTGNHVICMDIDEKKIANLRKGIIPIYEPGLEEMVRKNVQEGRLEFTTSIKTAVQQNEIIFLCLPTPQAEDGSADLSHVLSVVEQVGEYMDGEKIIVSKSTVPVGTVDRIKLLLKKKTKHPFEVVSNPEFLKQGAAVQDLLKPDRLPGSGFRLHTGTKRHVELSSIHPFMPLFDLQSELGQPRRSDVRHIPAVRVILKHPIFINSKPSNITC